MTGSLCYSNIIQLGIKGSTGYNIATNEKELKGSFTLSKSYTDRSMQVVLVHYDRYKNRKEQ